MVAPPRSKLYEHGHVQTMFAYAQIGRESRDERAGQTCVSAGRRDAALSSEIGNARTAIVRRSVARLGFMTEGEVIHPDPAAEVSSGRSTHESEEGPNSESE